MIAEIVAIGTELLMGQIADSDAQMLSRELQSLGIAVYHHQVVGDNPQRMRWRWRFPEAIWSSPRAALGRHRMI